MSNANDNKGSKGGQSNRPLLLGALVVIIVIVGYVFATGGDDSQASARYFKVTQNDFLVSITEGGNLEAVNEVIIRNEVEGSSRIVYIIPEGSLVKKGDLLVELDSADAMEKLNQQEIAFARSNADYVQAENTLEIQKSIIQSDIDASQLSLDFAIIDLEKFRKGERAQQIRAAEIAIQQTEEALLLAKDELEWSKKLFDQGFETKSTVDRGNLTVLRQQLDLEEAKTAQTVLISFDIPKMERQYVSDVEEAKKELQRVIQQGENKLTQYETDLLTEKNTLDLQKTKVENDRLQLDNTKIYAPQNGFVVYQIAKSRFSSESLIEEGATVRNRQGLITLPDTSQMQVEVKVHESHIRKVQPGLTAFVVLDSAPDVRYKAVVTKVAGLPDTQSRWANPNLNVYKTKVVITDPLPPDLKPGVSAKTEIVITNILKTLTVPIQSVTTMKGQQVVYLSDSENKPVPVTVGMFNSKFIEITKGIKDGDRVLLSPPMEADGSDLGDAVISDGEDVSAEDLKPDTEALKKIQASTKELNEESEKKASGFNRDALMKQFDKDGDGKLSDAEKAAMRSQFGGSRARGQGGGEGRGGGGGNRGGGAGGGGAGRGGGGGKQ
jgi:HlyD family secretion protein